MQSTEGSGITLRNKNKQFLLLLHFKQIRYLKLLKTVYDASIL